MRDIIITLPQKEHWATYAEELRAVVAGSILNFRLPSLPKESGEGARCYLVHRGYIVGFMYICGLVVRDGFTCATTGNYWAAGPYVQRNGPFYFFQTPRPKKGFQGWAYYDQAHDHNEFLVSYNGTREKAQTAQAFIG